MSKPMFCAVDLETTGTNPNKDQILQVGLVLFDMNRIYATGVWLVEHDRYEGDPYALAMNSDILWRIAREKPLKLWDGYYNGYKLPHAITEKVVHINDLYHTLSLWLGPDLIGNIHPVGFNVGHFDCAFLKNIPGSPVEGLFNRRVIELGTVFRGQDGAPMKSSEVVPKFLGKEVGHDALGDALDAAYLYMHATELLVK